MAKCDLCGGDCAAHELAQLLTQYQAANVRDVCPACRRWAGGGGGGVFAQEKTCMSWLFSRALVDEAKKG